MGKKITVSPGLHFTNRFPTVGMWMRPLPPEAMAAVQAYLDKHQGSKVPDSIEPVVPPELPVLPQIDR